MTRRSTRRGTTSKREAPLNNAVADQFVAGVKIQGAKGHNQMSWCCPKRKEGEIARHAPGMRSKENAHHQEQTYKNATTLFFFSWI